MQIAILAIGSFLLGLNIGLLVAFVCLRKIRAVAEDFETLRQHHYIIQLMLYGIQDELGMRHLPDEDNSTERMASANRRAREENWRIAPPSQEKQRSSRCVGRI